MIVVPAYNEAENIGAFVADWYPVVERHEAAGTSRLIVVDDGSTDDTFRLLCDLAESRPYLTPLTKPNGGHGTAVLYGYRYALHMGADFIFQTDSDGQTDPAEFEEFWQKRHSFDAIFGNRKERGDGHDRAFVEIVLCRVLKHYFGVRIPDANAPFRLMTRSYLEEFLPKMPEDYDLPNVMLTTFGVYYRKKVEFLPISFGQRQGGTGSMNVKNIVKTGWHALKDFKTFKKKMAVRPGK